MPETNPPADPIQVRLPLLRFTPTVDGRVVGEVMGSTVVPPGAVSGQYLGPNGYTTDVAQATDFRGAPGMTIVEGETVEVVGPAGPAGIDGESAYSAWLAAGNAGSEGDFLTALKGEPGEQGPRGNTGDAGPQGAKGDAGEAGPKGDTGAAGPKGDVGAKGDIGLTGLTGAKGDTGSQGAQGLKGDTGAQGIQGSQGIQGVAGANGTNGATWVNLPDVNMSDQAVIALAVGARRKTIACAGALVGDKLAAFPYQGSPTGYVIGDCFCLAAGQITISFNGPALGLGMNNNIPLKIVAFR